jgi:protein FRG1
MSGVVSKKLKFKGDKPKKKKRSHRETEDGGDGIEDFAVLAAADPRGGSLLGCIAKGRDELTE